MDQNSRVIELRSPADKRAEDALKYAAWQAHQRELRKAFEEGHELGLSENRTDNWIAGAKVGAFCGLLVGLAVGVAGGMFWMAAGFAAK